MLSKFGRLANSVAVPLIVQLKCKAYYVFMTMLKVGMEIKQKSKGSLESVLYNRISK